MPLQLLLRGAKQLLTLRGTPAVRRGAEFGELAIIPDGSVLIRDGKIASVGPTRRLENMHEARDAVDVPVHGCVVMPGFVDSGLHLPLFESAKRSARPRRKRLDDFSNEGISLMRSCLQHGTLTAGIRAYTEMGTGGTDLIALRQLAKIGDNPVNMVRSWSYNRGCERRSREAVADLLALIRKNRLAGVVELPGDVEPDTAADLISAGEYTPMDFHLDWRGGDPMHLDRLLNTAAPSSVFCPSQLSADECRLLAQSDATAIFRAGGHLLEERPGGSLRDLAEAGGALALSSGYDAEEQMNFNMQWVVALAVLRLQLSVEQAIVASTINAAYAMNCGHLVGSLEVKKRADILVLSLDDYREFPRRLGTNHVVMVIRNGSIVFNRTRWRVGAA